MSSENNNNNNNNTNNENNDKINFIKNTIKKLTSENNLLNDVVEIKSANINLNTEKFNDYPLLNKKEMLLRAYYKDCVGDAFTGDIKNYKGTFEEILKLDNLPILVATLNVLMKYLGLINKTEHCIDKEPEICAKDFAEYLKNEFEKDNITNINNIKIGIIGYQPAIISEMVKTFGGNNVLVSDLNYDNIGRIKYGATIYHGDMNEYIIKNSNIILCTGSTLANNTIWNILDLIKKYNKRIIFYGTTIAGVAELLNLERFCSCGK